MRIAAACALLLGVAWVGGCQDEHTVGPTGTGATLRPGVPIVSDPVPAALARAASRSVSQATGTDVVYVSLQPGTVPNGGLATIRNTRTGSSVTAAMDAGGFDPVQIDAQAGDVLAVQVELAGGGTETLTLRVPVTHRPGVVRTDPPPGKRDVPLNARIVVVFSEPINPGTVSGIRLLRGAAPIAGHTTLSTDGLRAEFQPTGLLAANAGFALSIPEDVADLSGERLEQPVTANFATGSSVIAASIATARPALITTPFSGTLRTFVMSAIRQNDGRVSGTFGILYPATGVRVFGRVTCFTIVDGKAAWIAGVVEGANDTSAVGQEDGWRVVDNGPPDGGVPDQLSLATPLEPGTLTAQDFCATTPVTDSNDGVIEEITLNNLISGDIVVNGSGPPPPPTERMSEIAFAAWPDGGIQVITADGLGWRALTTTAGDWNPVWSPDGTRLAFDRRGDPQAQGDIYVIAPDGSGLKRLTSGAFNDIEPAWSPDGSRIVFQRDGSIHVVNASDGSGLQALTGSGCDFYPTWSPDGSRIAFASCRSGTNAIYVINADGSGVKQLTSDTASNYFPRWSPDGTRIAFEHGPCCGVYVINPDGTGLAQLSLHGRTPSWSPDNRALVFEWYGIHIVNADGTGIHPLGVGFDPAWSPLGSMPPLLQPAGSVAVAPAADTLVVGDTVRVVAKVKDAAGNLLPGRLVDWAISDSTVASIRPGFGQDRVVTAVAAGIAKIAAMVDGKSDTTVVVVR